MKLLGLLLAAAAAHAQQQEFTEPVALLNAVAKTYAAGADTFRMESIADTTISADLRHEWTKVHLTAVKGPGNLYRIETRSGYGSYTQVSDGTNEWVYSIEGRIYVKRPLPENWPQFSRLYFAGNQELMNAWSMRMSLESMAVGYKHATMLPPETIDVEGRRYPCYVVHATNRDSGGSADFYSDSTFWIDKQALVFRKQVSHSSSYMLGSETIHIPFLQDTVVVYPATDFNPVISPETFRFAPPPGAKEVARLEPKYYTPPPEAPKSSMIGQPAPDVSFAGAGGKKIQLSSYRGKPLLLDFWATWCGPCLASMPGLNRIYTETRGTGLALLTFDQDNSDPEAAAEYLVRHNYGWTNYHDAGGEIGRAFKDEGIPLTVLLDAQGTIVYYGSGGDESAMRKAIARLGPEFAAVAPAPQR